MNSRIKALKRQLDETEEEVSREKAARRKTQRELEDLIAENESKEREITNLKNKLRYLENWLLFFVEEQFFFILAKKIWNIDFILFEQAMWMNEKFHFWNTVGFALPK